MPSTLQGYDTADTPTRHFPLLQQSQPHLPMTGQPPASTPPGAVPPPFPVYPCPPPMRFKPGEPFIPHLTYMEGQFAAQALIVEQQRRIKALEAELATTQIELMRLRNMSAPQRPLPTSRMQQPMRHDAQSQQAAGGVQQHDDAKKASSRYWTAEEHTRFLEGLELFGQKDIKAISRHVGTRSATQVRTHAQKYYLRIQRERAKADVDGKPPPTLSNDKAPPPKSKVCPSGNGRSGNSDESNSGSHTNGLPINSHSNSHNNSSSSTRNLIHTVNNNISNSHNHSPALENASNPPKPIAKAEQVINSVPQRSMPYASQPHLASNPNAAVPIPPNANVPVPHMSTSLNAHPFQPVARSSLHSVPKNIAMSNGSVGNASMGRSAARNMATQSNIRSTKAGTVSASAHLRQADEKPPIQPTQPRASHSNETAAIKKETETVKDGGKRAAPPTPKRSPKKRAKKPSVPTSSLAPMVPVSLPQPTLPKMNIPASASFPASAAQPPSRPLGESGGSMSNLRALLRMPEDAGPSSSKPPTLRRNGSSNSVLADLSKNCGLLSRSNSFVSPHGKGVTRSNSILSLLSGIPTALRESPSTERLLGLDGGEDKVMATLKSMETGGSSNLPSLAGAASTNSVGAMGDRSFSFGQLNHMGLDDLEDPGAVALALQEEQKWGDG